MADVSIKYRPGLVERRDHMFWDAIREAIADTGAPLLNTKPSDFSFTFHEADHRGDRLVSSMQVTIACDAEENRVTDKNPICETIAIAISDAIIGLKRGCASIRTVSVALARTQEGYHAMTVGASR